MKLINTKRYIKIQNTAGNIEIIDTQIDNSSSFSYRYMKDDTDNVYCGKASFGQVSTYVLRGTILEESNHLYEVAYNKPIKPSHVMQTWQCSSCGGELRDTWKYCPYCGVKIGWSENDGIK